MKALESQSKKSVLPLLLASIFVIFNIVMLIIGVFVVTAFVCMSTCNCAFLHACLPVPSSKRAYALGQTATLLSELLALMNRPTHTNSTTAHPQ